MGGAGKEDKLEQQNIVLSWVRDIEGSNERNQRNSEGSMIRNWDSWVVVRALPKLTVKMIQGLLGTMRCYYSST